MHTSMFTLYVPCLCIPSMHTHYRSSLSDARRCVPALFSTAVRSTLPSGTSSTFFFQFLFPKKMKYDVLLLCAFSLPRVCQVDWFCVSSMPSRIWNFVQTFCCSIFFFKKRTLFNGSGLTMHSGVVVKSMQITTYVCLYWYVCKLSMYTCMCACI